MSLADGTRLRISGSPTPEEIAAVTLALDQAAAHDSASRRRPGRPAWQTAARLEAVGDAIVRAPADLRPATRFSLDSGARPPTFQGKSG